MARQNTGKGKGGEANSLPVTGSSRGGHSATAVLMRCRFIEQKPGAITTKSGRLQNYTILESEKISKARDEYLAAEKERKRKKEEEEEKAKANDAGSGGQGLQAVRMAHPTIYAPTPAHFRIINQGRGGARGRGECEAGG